MTDQLQVDMIVKAISEGFDKLSKDVSTVGQAYDKSGKLIVNASGKVQSVTEATSTSVVQSTRKQEQAYERMASKMATQTNLIIQKQQELQRQQEQLASVTGKLAIGFGAAAVAGGALMGSAIKLAARVETLGVVTVQLGKNVGMTEKQIRALEESVMDQGITMQAARQSIARMVQGNIDLANATNLARLAQDAAVIAGINSSEAFERMTTAIATGQLRMLRTLGIMGTFERSYKELADQLGKTTEELTELEKVQARTNMVLEAGKNIAGAYEAAMDTAGKKITSLDRHLEESRRMLGEIWLPVYANVIDALTTSLKVWENLDKSIQDNISSFGGIVTITAAAMAVIMGGVSAVTKLTLALKTGTIAASLFGTSITIATGGLTLIVGAIAAVVVATMRAKQHFDALQSSMVGIENQARETAKWYGHYERQVKEAAEAEGLFIDENGNLIQQLKTSSGVIHRVVAENHLMTDSEWEASRAIKAKTAILAANKSSMESILEVTKGVTRGTIDMTARVNEYTEVQEEGTQAILDAAMAAKRLKEEQQALAIMQDMLAAGLQGNLLKAQDRYVDSMEKLREQQTDLIAEKQKLLKDGYDPEGEKIQEINEALGENVEAQREARTAIEETTAQMIYQQVASSLSTEAAIGLARAMGILSEQDALVAQLAEEAAIAFDESGNSMIDAGAEAENFIGFMVRVNDVIANLIQAGAEVTMENVAAAMAATSEKGGDVVGMLPDVVTGFEDVEVAANDGVGKAEELFDIVVDDSVEAIVKAGEVTTSVEEIGTSAETATPKVVKMFTDADTAMRSSVREAYLVKTALESIPGTVSVTIRINTVGNIPEGAYQHGGEMLPGMIGLVGEAGPELFVAPAKGTIIPHSQSTTFLAGLNRQTSTQVVGVGGETNVSKDTYQDILVEGDTFVVEGGDLNSVKAVASTYKKERLTQFVGR